MEKNQLEGQEREIHAEAMKRMDNFYRYNPPQENTRLMNILQEFEKDYLKLNRENQIIIQENERLKKEIETIKVLSAIKKKVPVDRIVQTDLTSEDLEQQKLKIEELKQELQKPRLNPRKLNPGFEDSS